MIKIQKLLFIRYTHDEDGNYRFPGEKAKKLNKEEGDAAFCVHMLDSNRYITFDEIYQEHINYHNTFPEDGPLPDKSDVALALFRLIEMDRAKCRIDSHANR